MKSTEETLDAQCRARIVGLALTRGLLGESVLREAVLREAVGQGGDLLQSLLAAGALDETDVAVLAAIPEGPAGRRPSARYQPACGPAIGDDEATLPPEGPRCVRDVMAVENWKRYRQLRFVAEGGLGRIFKAFDPSLHRFVALKFLRSEDPALVRRFMLEARHQAKVEHPNICQVFEVGMEGEQAYIAMPFIEGETLDVAAQRMSLAQKVEVLEIVAEAMHAAHRQGLIHRDIKPANILIEWREGSGPRPYVLDFGLARDVDAADGTMQGAILGTAYYMSPEQARGDGARIGRRTDVYGLGATLYKALTGRVLFQETSGWECLRRTIEDEPESPRRWLPDLPRDLEAIVLKCLEKNPEQRYESALALAEDLRRFREGEPIQARTSSWLERMKKRVKKHKLLFAVSSAAVIGMLTLGAWGLAVRLQARRVAGYAAAFGAEAESMSATLRMAYLLPPHDIRAHKEDVRRRMARIRDLIRLEGLSAEGPGAYALGQGHLALREYSEARVELERAWAKGYRQPDVSLALGQALGELYRKGREDLVQIGDLKQREARKQELASQLREPALAHLRLGAGHKPQRRAFLEGLLAFYGEHYPAAISKAQEAFSQEPTLYEAKVLEGNALVAMGLGMMEAKPDEFVKLLHSAARSYQTALDMARSDPMLIAAEGVRQGELARYAYLYAASPLDEHAKIQGWFDRALAVDPSLAQVYTAKARLAAAYAVYLGDRGRDPFRPLDEAIAWCGMAGRMGDDRLVVAPSLGEYYRWKALYERERGIEPDASLQRALACFQEALSTRPGDAWSHQRLAEACSLQSDVAFERGEDPRPFLKRGLSHIDQAFRLSGSCNTALTAATLHCSLGDWERAHGVDPGPSYRQALFFYEEAIRRSPADGDLYTGVADVAVRFASHLHAQGEPASAIVARGLDAAAKSVMIEPTYLHLLNQGDCLRLWAHLRLDGGEDPADTLSEAEAAFTACERINPTGDFTLYVYQGLLATVAGHADIHREQSPEIQWRRAAGLFMKAARMNPYALEPHLAVARLAWMHADWLGAHQKPPGAVIDMGLEATVRGFRRNARQPELLAIRGCLLQLQGQTLSDPIQRRQTSERAQRDLSMAIAENAFLSTEFGPELRRIEFLLKKSAAL